MYAIHQESQGAVNSKHESKPRNLRLKIKVHNKQAKKPSAKTKYKLPKSLEQDCKGGGDASAQYCSLPPKDFVTSKQWNPGETRAWEGGDAFEIKNSYPSGDLQKPSRRMEQFQNKSQHDGLNTYQLKPSRRMEQFQNKSHHEGWNTYKLKPSQRMNQIQ